MSARSPRISSGYETVLIVNPNVVDVATHEIGTRLYRKI